MFVEPVPKTFKIYTGGIQSEFRYLLIRCWLRPFQGAERMIPRICFIYDIFNLLTLVERILKSLLAARRNIEEEDNISDLMSSEG